MVSPAVSPQVPERFPASRRELIYVTVAACALSVITIALWPNLLKLVFSSDFMPHLYCYLEKPGLIWTHVISDVLIGLSYFVISGALAYLVYKWRSEIPFYWMFAAFGLFIVTCGLTHILEAVTVWVPIYVFQGGVKVVTALASLSTAVLLPFTIKPVQRLLAKARASEQHRNQVQSALAERNVAQKALERSHAELEAKVRRRTVELAEINLQLTREITERSQAEAWLAELAAIVENSQDAIISKTLGGRITTWNQGAERLYGYSAAEVIGQSISIILPKDREQELQAILRQVAEGERVEQFETERVRKDGQVIDVAVSVSPIKDKAGNVIRASTIARDITSQKVAEEAVRRSEAQYRLLFDNNPMPMWVFDCKTLAFMAVNEAAVRHYGYSRQEFLEMTILDIRPTEEIPKLLQLTKQPLKGLSEVALWRHRKKDGTIIDVEITSHNLSLDGREAELVLANDVTARIRNEQKLQESEERFSKAFWSSPFPLTISTFDDGRYLEVNEAFLRVVGYDRDDLIGHTAVDMNFWPDRRTRDSFLEQLNELGQVRAFETQLPSKSGGIKNLQVSAEIIQLGGMPCVLAISNDITESKRLEEQLRQAQKMEAVGRLAGGVAHDFNNVLGVIIGYSELAQGDLDQENPVYAQVREIKKAADRAASLTRQLLAFSRQQILQPASHNLNNIVENLLTMLKRMVAEDVEVSFAPGSPLGNIYVDRGQIEQVLMNLAVNARDAMPEGGKLIIETANAELDESYAKQHLPARPGAYVRLSVSDNGVGMDTVTMSRIFEPFFTTKELGRGTGLGLSIVYGIVKQSGGYIWVYSEPGQGTTFKIYFPRIEAPAQLISESKPEEAPLTGTETILLVEDDEALRNLVARLLRSSGYTVLEAADAASAIDIAKRDDGQIKMLLSDVIMSNVSGPELAQNLRAFRPELKVILMSGYAGDVIARRGVLDSKAVFIEKPFTKAVLLSRVRSVLES